MRARTPIRHKEHRIAPKRWLRFGPGLVLALIAILLLWRQLPPAAGPGGPPRLERTRVEEAPTPPPSAPDPDWLLRQKEFLGLSSAQVEKLEKRKARWDRDTKELRGALGRAAADFRRGVETRGGGGVTVEALRERAQPVSELSRQLAEARRAWWGDAASVLTPAQRRQAEQAWARRFVPTPPQKDHGTSR